MFFVFLKLKFFFWCFSESSMFQWKIQLFLLLFSYELIRIVFRGSCFWELSFDFIRWSFIRWSYAEALYAMMMIMMMKNNYFCGMIDRRKAFSLVSCRDHFQMSASWVWTCAEPEFRLSWMKLCSSDNHGAIMSWFQIYKHDWSDLLLIKLIKLMWLISIIPFLL